MSSRLSELKMMVRLFAIVRNSRVTHMSVENIRKACIAFIKSLLKCTKKKPHSKIREVIGNETPESFFDTQLNVGECKLKSSNGNSVHSSIFNAFFKRAIEKINIDTGAYFFLVDLKVCALKEELTGHENDKSSMQNIICNWLKHTEAVRQRVNMSQIGHWIATHANEGNISKLCHTVVRRYFTDCSFFGSSEWQAKRKAEWQLQRTTEKTNPYLDGVMKSIHPRNHPSHEHTTSQPTAPMSKSCGASSSRSIPRSSASSSSKSAASTSKSNTKRSRVEEVESEFREKQRRRQETFDCFRFFDAVTSHKTYMGFSKRQKSMFKKCFTNDYMDRKLSSMK